MDTKRVVKRAVKLLMLSSFLLWNLAFAAPEGGTVVQGSAEISQTQNQTVINQSSQNTVINWNSFNTASHEAVLFNQPNSSSIALNRITNGLPTQFAGSLNANGQVWILNPAGVLFTPTARVDVAGLVATTHGILDANFMAGNYQFDLVPGYENAKIINNGLISVKDSGIVALVGPGVENNGVIIANLGKVHLASGSAYTLDMYGDSLINFGSSAPIQNGSVSNSGLIKADGGKVYMTAKSASAILDNVVSMSGVIEANAVSVNQKGEIVLHGGSEGTTIVSGKLHAQGGGHIETSGAHLIIEPSTEIDAGVGGSWLMDPTDITVDSTLATIINGQLNAGTNVTLNTASGGTDAGNITVISPITATTASATLSFIADNDITINSPISVRSTFSANAAQTTASGKIFIGADITSLGAQTYSDAVVINANSILTGSAFSFASTINDSSSYGHSLKINSSSYPTFSGAVSGITPLLSLWVVIPSTNTPTIAALVASQLNAGTDITIEATGASGIDGFVAHSPLTQSSTPSRVPTLTLLANNGSVNLSNTPVTTTNANVVMTGTTFVVGGGSIGGNLTKTAPALPIGGSNTTGGTQTYNGGAQCQGANCFFTSTNGSITFNGTLSAGGGADWIFSAANGILTFADSVVGGLNTISTTAQAIVFNPNNLSNMSFTACCGMTFSAPVTIGTNNAGTMSFTGPVNLNSTVDGPGNLTLNSSTLFRGNVGGITPLASLVANGPIQLNNSSLAGFVVKTVAAQNFTNSVTVTSNAAFTSTTGSITFAGGLTGGVDTFDALGGSVNFNSAISVASLSVLNSAPTVINTAAITATTLQSYSGPVTLSAATTSLNTSSGGTITFGSIVNGASNLTLNTVSSGIVNFNGAVGATTALTSLSIPNSPTININTGTTSIRTVDSQTYSGPILFNSLAAINFIHTNLTAPRAITFNSTVRSAVTSTAITITGNLAVGPSGSIGIGSPVPVASLSVSGTTLGPNVTTAGNQNYAGALTLNTDETMTSTGGSISFGSTINGDGVLGRNLTVNAATTATFNGIVGGSVPLASLTVTAPSVITVNTSLIRTTGNQTYNSTVQFPQFVNPTFTSTVNGNMIFNAVSGSGNFQSITVNAAGTANFFGTVGFPGDGMNFIDVTAANGIFITLASGQRFGANQSIIMRSNLVVNGSVSFEGVTGSFLLMGTVDGPGSLSLFMNGGVSTTFSSTVGATTPLNSLSLLINSGSHPIRFNNTIRVTNGFSHLGGSGVFFDAPTPSVSTVGSLSISTGTVYFHNTTLTSSGNQTYATGAAAPPIVLQGNTTLNATGAGAAITFWGSINNCTIAGGNCVSGAGPFDLTLSAPLGSVVFRNAVGTAAPLNNLTVTGPTTVLALVPVDFTTVGNQLFNSPFVDGYNSTFTSTAGNITFASTLDSCPSGGGCLAAPYGVTINIAGSNALTFGGAVGSSPLALAFLTVNGPATSKTIINGGSVRTSGAQNYTNPIQLGADAVLTSTSSTLNFVSINSDGTPRGLTLTAPGITTLSGNIGTAISPAGILRFLTITNASNINTAIINTTQAQTYGGAVTLSLSPTLTTNASGTITFGSTIQGGFNLIANASSSGTVNFSGDIGTVGTPLTSLTVTGLANINTNVAPTIFVSGTQTYNQNVLLNSLAAITFGSGIGSTTVFNGTVNRTVTSTAITIAGNLIVGASGSIGLSSIIQSLVVNGTTLGPNVTTAGPQNYVGALTLNTDETMTSTGGSITYGSTVDGDGVSGRNLIVSTATGAIFSGHVGSIVPLASLTVNGTTTFNRPVSQVVNTVGSQIYSNTVTLATDITMTATGNSGVLGNDIVSFGLGAAGIYSDVFNTRSLTVFTNNAANGASGAGISGTVNVGGFTMGGTGGGDISPISMDSFVGGQGGVQAWNNTVLHPAATGMYCVNGFCISGTRVLTINADNDSKFYGQIFTPTLFTATGLATGDSITSITLVSAGSPASATVAGSPYVINASNASGPGIANHYTSIVYDTAPGFLTVNAAPLTLTSDSQSKNYGTTLPSTTTFFTPTGLQNGETVGTVDIVSAGLAPTASVAGSPYAITSVSNAAGGTFDPNNYAITYVAAGTITVNPVPLSIDSSSQVKTYGTTLPSTTTFFTSSGLQNGETVGTVDIVSAGLPGTASVAGSPYAITGVSNAAGGTFNPVNYTITYNPLGTITVNPAALTLTSTSQTKNYGTTLPSTTTFFTPTGLQNGETVGTVDIVSAGLPGTASVTGSPYAITAVSNAAGGTFDPNNYIISYTPAGTITVNAAALNITPDAQIKNYGVTLPSTTSLFTPTGLQNGETIGTVDIVSAGLAPTASVLGSPYAITAVSNAVGGTFNPNNYVITYTPANTITVNAAPLTLTSDSQIKNYGTTLPSTTTFFTPSGLQNGETVGTVDIVSLGLAPTANVVGSPYAITGVSNAAGGTFDVNNYAVTYVAAGTITVNPAVLNITPDAQIKTYGTTLPSTTSLFTPTGLQNGETVGTIDISSAGLAPTASVLGGPYAITGSNATGGTFDPNNYAITYLVGGPITVNPAALNITSDSQIKNYGTTLPSTTTFFTPTGLQNGESIGTVDIISAGLSPTASVLGGPYAITGVSNAAGGTFDVNNYAVTYTPAGNITVNPAALTITSDPQTKLEGVTLPPTTTEFTPVGLQNLETIGTVDITSAGLVGSAPVGNYPITNVMNATGGTFDPNNYAINYVAFGDINVIAAPLPPPINLINLSPLQLFELPDGLNNCGILGCVISDIILIDPLGGFGINNIFDITVYPEGYLDTTIDGIQPLGAPIGVVISELGDTQAVGEFGTRELGIGTPVFKSDSLVAQGNSCVCIKTQEKDKKCYSNTESYPEWKSECRAQNVQLQNNVYIKNAVTPKQHLLKDVIAMMKLHHPVEQKPAVKNDPKISWEHYPMTGRDMYNR